MLTALKQLFKESFGAHILSVEIFLWEKTYVIPSAGQCLQHTNTYMMICNMFNVHTCGPLYNRLSPAIQYAEIAYCVLR